MIYAGWARNHECMSITSKSYSEATYPCYPSNSTHCSEEGCSALAEWLPHVQKHRLGGQESHCRKTCVTYFFSLFWLLIQPLTLFKYILYMYVSACLYVHCLCYDIVGVHDELFTIVSTLWLYWAQLVSDNIRSTTIHLDRWCRSCHCEYNIVAKSHRRICLLFCLVLQQKQSC